MSKTITLDRLAYRSTFGKSRVGWILWRGERALNSVTWSSRWIAPRSDDAELPPLGPDGEQTFVSGR